MLGESQLPVFQCKQFAFLDFMPIKITVPSCKGNLPGPNPFIRFLHGELVGLDICICIEREHCRQSLRDRPGLQHHHIPIRELGRLLRCHNDVLVVGQHEHCFCRGRVHRRKDVVGRRIHRLTARDDVIRSEVLEKLVHPLACRNCNKPIFP